MKIYLLSGLFCILLIVRGAAQQIPQAQEPASDVDSGTVIIQPPVPNRQAPKQSERIEFTEENSVRLQPEEIPPALRKTLENAEYKGWEEGVINRNIITNEYKVEIQNQQEVKIYYFDQNGEPLPDP